MGEAVALFKRVSSDQQEIRNQDDTLAAHVAANGYDVRRVFTLPDTSAYKGRHAAALAEALADVEAGKYTRIVAVTSSRFERRGEKIGIGYALKLDKAGGRLETCDNPLFGDLSNAGGWHVTVAALGGDNTFAKNLSGSVNRGFARMDKDELRGNGYVGAAFRGMPPAGYSVQGEYQARYLVKDTGQPERVREYKGETKKGRPRGPRTRYLAAGIAEAFELAATGESTTALGRKLGMTATTVQMLLRNPVYSTGRHEVKRHDGVTVIHRCEPLVTPDVQALAVAGLAVRRRGDNGTSRQLRRALVEADPDKADFSGSLWCGQCDVVRPAMYRYFGGGKPHTDGTPTPRVRRYMCSKRMSGCGRSVNADAADAVVSRLMSESTRPWGRIVHIPGDDNSAEITRVRDELADLPKRNLSDDDEDAERTRLRGERKRLEAMPRTPARTEWRLGGETIGQRWASLDMAGRREWLLSDFKVRVRNSGNRDGSVTAEISYPDPLRVNVEHGHDLGNGLRATEASGTVILWKEDK